MSHFFIFITQVNLPEPCGWKEFEMCLWPSVPMPPPFPEVGSLSIMVVPQTHTTHVWVARPRMVAAFLPAQCQLPLHPFLRHGMASSASAGPTVMLLAPCRHPRTCQTLWRLRVDCPPLLPPLSLSAFVTLSFSSFLKWATALSTQSSVRLLLERLSFSCIYSRLESQPCHLIRRPFCPAPVLFSQGPLRPLPPCVRLHFHSLHLCLLCHRDAHRSGMIVLALSVCLALNPEVSLE